MHASTDSDMWCMLNAAIKEEHADGGHAYPLALVCGSSGMRCRGGEEGLWEELLAEVSELGRRRAHGKHGTCSKTWTQGMRTCKHAVTLPEHWAGAGH